MNDKKNADEENPWDDPGGGRTIAMDGPSFEVPADVPSPITPRPPPMPVTKAAKATLVGMMPQDLMRRPVPKAEADTPRMPQPIVLPKEAVAELRATPRSPGFAPAPPVHDKEVETEVLSAGDPRLRMREMLPQGPKPKEVGASRHQDAHVVVGQGAVGDEATLAIGPGQAGLGKLPDPSTLGPPLGAVTPASTPAALSSDNLQAAAMHAAPVSYGGVPAASTRSPSWQNVPQSHAHPPAGFDPLVPQAPPVQSGLHPASAPQPGWAPFPHAPQAPPAPAPVWVPPPAAPAGPRVKPQLLLLVGVGIVCVAIFVTGIVLFVTTKF